MKRIIILLAAGLALMLTGCATNYDAYVKAQVAIIEAQSAAETNRLMAMTKIAESGDATVKSATVMGLALTGNKQMTTLQAPVDPLMQWASILVPSLTNLYGINRNTSVQLANINADTEKYGLTIGAIRGVSETAINKEPVIVGPSEGFGVMYPREPVPVAAPVVPAE